jgi:hypothetical protein
MLLVNVWNDVGRGRSIARIAKDEDMTTLGRADGKCAQAMFCLELFDLALLLSPLAASLALVALVRLGKELLDGNDGDRLGWRDNVSSLLGVLATSSLLTSGGSCRPRPVLL